MTLPAATAERIRSAAARFADELVAALADVEPATAAPEKLLTVVETLQVIGVARSTLYGLLDRGEIRSLTIGRRRLVPRSSIDQFIARGTVK